MKPAPRSLAAQLSVLAQGGELAALRDVSHLAFSGRTSLPVDPAIAPALYRVAGFKVAGTRAIRVDILERLADLIRPAIAYRPGTTIGEPPPGTADGDGFIITGAMTSLGRLCGGGFSEILKSLGYRMETRPGPAITKPILRPAPMVALAPVIEPANPPPHPTLHNEEGDAAAIPAGDEEGGTPTPPEALQTPEPPPAAAEAEPPVRAGEDAAAAAAEEPAEALPGQDLSIQPAEADAPVIPDAPVIDPPMGDDAAMPIPAEVVNIEIWRIPVRNASTIAPITAPERVMENHRPPRRDWNKNRPGASPPRPRAGHFPRGRGWGWGRGWRWRWRCAAGGITRSPPAGQARAI